MEQGVPRLGSTAEMNDAGAHELVLEDIDDPFHRFIVQRSEHVIDQQPGRRLQENTRQSQSELLVLAQLPVPASCSVE